MYRVPNIAAYPKQTQALNLPDGTAIQFTLRFSQLQQCWFANVVYGDFTLNGVQVTNQPNILYQYRNQIPFGLSCYSKQNREPSLLEDFFSGNSVLYIMTEDEVNAYVEYLSGQTPT